MQFDKTYLYKLHQLSNSLDKAFEQTLRNYTNIGLSQFSLLLAIDKFIEPNQRKVSRFLGLSGPAISRQVTIAEQRGYITVRPSAQDRHGHILKLTPQGKDIIATALLVLQQHLFHIFDEHNRQTSLMDHIETLLSNTKGVINAQQLQKQHIHSRKRISI